MAAPYIPPKDVDLVTWADNFSALITAAPATYGLTATDASTIAAAVVAYDASYAQAVNPTTRSPTTVAQKNTDKQAMLPILRTYASQIRLNPGVMNADKTALGLNLVNNTPSPINAPTTVPLLAFIAATPGQHTLRYADQNTPASRAKPQGVIAMQLFLGVNTTPIVDPALCSFYASVTSQPVAVTFSPADAGKVATYFGRWINRGKVLHTSIAPVGPFSAAINAIIPSM